MSFTAPGRERIALEVPRAGEMREKESRLWLASNSEKDPELPPDFLKCSEYASGKKPHPSIFPLNAQIVNSHFGFVIKLGSTKKYAIVEDSFRFTAAHSKPGLRANGPTAMKYTWFYKRPKGSLYKIEGRRQGEVLDIKIDAVGVHLMALRVEDDSGECNTASVELLVTANPPYIFPSFSIKELEEAFSMKWFKPHLDKIQARKSWKYSQGEGVTIAVLDSGVNYFTRSSCTISRPTMGRLPATALMTTATGLSMITRDGIFITTTPTRSTTTAMEAGSPASLLRA